MFKKCFKCGKTKNYSEFNKCKAHKNGLKSECKACTRKRSEQWYEKEKQKYLKDKEYYKKELESRRQWYHKNKDRILKNQEKDRIKLKIEVFNSYGGCKCKCCGENILEFLSIDHVNGGGTQHRKEVKGGYYMYKWLKKNNYPSGFQVLCHNCNQAKGYYGVCPHQKIKEGMYESMD